MRLIICVNELILINHSHEVKTALETLLEAKDLHMHKLNRIRTDMNSGVPLNSNALIQIRAIFSPSDRELQLANERAILQLLWFDTINSRHCEIFEAETNTFTWILNDSNVQRLSNPLLVTDFKTWLQTGSGVFHISGKPGSGKSTLMKYLCESAETERHLQQWVGT
jgi:hypothetical protein